MFGINYRSALRIVPRLTVALAIGLLSVLILSPTAQATTYTVSNTNDSGAGSLRQAITDANGNVGADTISFNISGAGPHIITIGSPPLPQITGPTNFDAITNQAGASCGALVPASLPATSNTPHNLQIVLDGYDLDASDQAILSFASTADNSSVRGLAFVDAGGGAGEPVDSILIQGIAGSDTAINHTIECNYFGVMPDGTTEAPNGGSNIMATVASGITVRNNLLANYSNFGAMISGLNAVAPYTTSTVADNLFGTLADGLTPASGNYGALLLVDDPKASVAIQHNIVGGSDSEGINIGDGDGATIESNYIGVNINQEVLSNTGGGLHYTRSEYSNETAQIQANLIAHNWDGINVSAYNNNDNSTSSIAVQNNIVRDNRYDGIYVFNEDEGTMFSVTNNVVYSNGTTGIMSSGSNNIINNTIYNNTDGIEVAGEHATVQGNKVGLDQADNPAGNRGDGIVVYSSSYFSYPNQNVVTIGGNSTNERNYIAGNRGNGIHLVNTNGDSCPALVSTAIIGNYIGTNPAGAIQSGYGNDGSGVAVNEVRGLMCVTSIYKHKIGGDGNGEQNIIAGNNEDGIRIFQADDADVFSISFMPNSIYGNRGMGINLAHDNDNDGIADTDLGPNPLNNKLMSYPAINANYYINRPAINGVSFNGNNITVNYNFQANGITPSADITSLRTANLVGYRLDFYLNDGGQDGTYAGFAQGKTHLGSFIVDGSEINASHSFVAPIAPIANQNVTATATVLWQNIGTCTGGQRGDGPPYEGC